MTKKEQQFINRVWQYYRTHGRHDLPWRQKSHLKPYPILVSELMLQQTQVVRVVPKYKLFLRRWPTVKKLASASLGDVLRVWQGLGYNRRAKFLHHTAQIVSQQHRGRFPRTYEDLQLLPGVGHYTAAAVMNFAYNLPTSMIETNIRTVYIHHFFPAETAVTDSVLRTMIARTVDTTAPREWYWALMDYGAHLKLTVGNQNHKSAQYSTKSTFEGSDRQIRGAIVRLAAEGSVSRARLLSLPFDRDRIITQSQRLLCDGLLTQVGQSYQLP